MHFLDLLSIFFLFLGTKMAQALQPKILKWELLGFFFVHASYGVLTSIAFEGNLFRV